MKDYQELFEKFVGFLEIENKQEAVKVCLDSLKNNEIDVVGLYTEILTPALNNMTCSLKEKRICIWKEHVRTAIVRTIVECCYSFVIAEREKQNIKKHGSAVIICPPEENHELGARMVADFFTLCGYDAVFVGSNTPYNDFFNAVDIICPDFIAISVSNFYNIIITTKIVKDLRAKAHASMKIVVGGNAFNSNSENIKLVGADYFAKSFEDIQKIVTKGQAKEGESK